MSWRSTPRPVWWTHRVAGPLVPRGNEVVGRRRGLVQPAQGPVLIAGLIRSYSPRKGILTIVAGADGTIKGRVAKEAKVTLYTADYSIARPGDAITQLTRHVDSARGS